MFALLDRALKNRFAQP